MHCSKPVPPALAILARRPGRIAEIRIFSYLKQLVTRHVPAQRRDVHMPVPE